MEYAEVTALPAYAEGSVFHKVSAGWREYLVHDVLECPADSVVGSAVVLLCANADVLLSTEAEDGGALERDVEQKIRRAIAEQAGVWFFG